MSATAAPTPAVPAVGTVAPDFSLASTSGETVTLSALRGTPVLLAFFPAAFTSVCTAEMCAFTDDWDAFGASGVRVLPISVDGVPSLAEFRKQHALRTELLSDFRREASRAYGTLLEKAYLSNRAYFLIDGDGIVRWAHVEEHPGKRRENAEILAAIGQLG
ncbi:MAG TPA: peroxiredoxin [Gemmatirosa sp.]|jgi:peroxiredoxin|nr:peroxiredoxin [Gemmatirosa sp.]